MLSLLLCLQCVGTAGDFSVFFTRQAVASEVTTESGEEESTTQAQEPSVGMDEPATEPPTESEEDGVFDGTLTWNVDETGCLVIGGVGRMRDRYLTDYPWYAQKEQINSVRVEEGVENLGTYIFEEYDALETVFLADSVLQIGDYAFNYCDNLCFVQMPKSLQSVGRQAFFMCPLLTDVHIVNPDAWFNISFATDASNPLCNGADLYCEDEIVTSVTVPEDIANINGFCFIGCRSLTEVVMHDNVTSVGQSAFADCKNLRSVHFSLSLQTIEADAFAGCESLLSVQLPESFVELADTAFNQCTALRAVYYDGYIEKWQDLFATQTETMFKDITVYGLSDGGYELENGNLYSENGTVELIASPEKVLSVREGTKTVAQNAGKDLAKLSVLLLPDGLETIGASAFGNSERLTTVCLPASLVAVADGAFSDSNQLTDVYFDGTEEQWKTVLFGAGNEALKNADVHFATSLHKEDHALYSADKTKLICVNVGYPNIEFTVPETVTGIAAGAFADCTALQSVHLHDNITDIGNFAFAGCFSLKEIKLPDTLENLSDFLFADCDNLQAVQSGKNITAIGDGCFMDCRRLAEFQIPETVSHIGEYAFAGGLYLQNADLPQGLTTLAKGIFANCARLESVNLPQNLQTISAEAFLNCRKLGDVAMPDTVQTIGAAAFRGCDSLQKIHLPEHLATLPDSLFYECFSLAKVDFPPTLTAIGAYAFYDCISLTEINLPETLEEIGSYAFHGCESLKDIVIPAGVTRLQTGVFMACLQVKNVTFADTIGEIDQNAFAYCQTMNAVYLPAGVQRVDRDAFFRCSALKNIYSGGTREEWETAVPDGLSVAVQFGFEHRHTIGKWDILVYPQPDTEGLARRNCEQCHAIQMRKMPAAALACDEKATINVDGFLWVRLGLTADELLARAAGEAVLRNLKGETVQGSVPVGTGMTLTVSEDTVYTVLVLGDSDGNGIITAKDARYALRLSIGIEDYASDSVLNKACDVDASTDVRSADARIILRASVDLENPDEWKC